MHSAHLGLDVAVGERPAPGPGPHHPRAALLVAEVERRALRRLVVTPGEEAEFDRLPRWPGGRRPDRLLARPGLAREQPDRREVAELALAGPHRRRRVALQDLRARPSLAPRDLEVGDADVLAQTHRARRPRRSARCGSLARRSVALGHGISTTRGASARDRLVERTAGPGDVAGADHGEPVPQAQEVVARHETDRHDERVARDRAGSVGPRDPHPLDPSPSDRAEDPSVPDDRDPRVRDRIGDVPVRQDRADPHPRRAEHVDVLDRFLGAGGHDGLGGGTHAVRPREPSGAAPQPHPGHVVPLEDPVHLDRAGRDHDPSGLDVHRLPVPRQRDERPVVHAHGHVPLGDLDPGLGTDLRRQSHHPIGERAGREPLPGPALVGQEDLVPRLGRRQGRSEPGGARADHQHVGARVPDPRPSRRRRDRQPSDAGRPADHPLRDRPREPGTDERLRVEPHRQQGVQTIGDRQQVALGRWPAGLPTHALTVVRGGRARPPSGFPVDVHEAVRAVPGHAVEPASAVVLQRPVERPHPGAEQRRGDRVTVVDGNRAALEVNRAHRPDP